MVSVHGWGGNPLFLSEHTIKLEEEMVKCGSEPQKTIMLSLGTQGVWGTVEGDPREKDIEMVPDQIQGTIDQVVDDLVESKTKNSPVSTREEIPLEQAFWNRLKLVVGHSMGGWAVLRWRLKYNKAIQDRRGNDKLRILLMSMVTVGPGADREQKEKAKKYLNIEPDEKNVTLLTAPIRGFLVGNVDQILKYPALKNLAEYLQIINLLVTSYMGKAREWEKILHQESILNDLPMIAANNFMLRHAGSLIQSDKELEYTQQLVKEELVHFATGRKDEILFPTPILKAIKNLGGHSIVDITQHYSRPEHNVFGYFAPRMMQ